MPQAEAAVVKVTTIVGINIPNGFEILVLPTICDFVVECPLGVL